MKKSNTEEGPPLVAWNKRCLPKSRSELGLRKKDVTNKVFQRKLAWKVLTNAPGLRVQFMRAKYLFKSNLLNYKQKSIDSLVWKSSLSSRDVLKKSIIWKIVKDD